MERSFKKMIKNYLPNIQIVVPASKIIPNLENNSSTPQPPSSQQPPSRIKQPQPRVAPIEDTISEE